MGELETGRDVPIKLRIFVSCLPIKSFHFGEHPETTPYRPTYSTAHTLLQPHRGHRDRCLRQLRGLLHHQLSAVGGYWMRGRLPLLEENVRGRDRLHRESSEAVTSAVLL